jgi:hypothetical protein
MIQYKTMKTNERNFLASRRDFLWSIAALGAVGGCRSLGLADGGPLLHGKTWCAYRGEELRFDSLFRHNGK